MATASSLSESDEKVNSLVRFIMDNILMKEIKHKLFTKRVIPGITTPSISSTVIAQEHKE